MEKQNVPNHQPVVDVSRIPNWRYSKILKGSPIRWTQMDFPWDAIRALWRPCNIFNRCRTQALCRVGNEFLWIAELLLLSLTSTTWVLKPAGSHHHITTSPHPPSPFPSTQAPLPHPAARRRGVPCSPPLAHGPVADAASAYRNVQKLVT